MSQQSGSEVVRMLLLVAGVVAVVILVFFAIGYGLGRLLL
jgi:preprotein translocase subunit SecE